MSESSCIALQVCLQEVSLEGTSGVADAADLAEGVRAGINIAACEMQRAEGSSSFGFTLESSILKVESISNKQF